MSQPQLGWDSADALSGQAAQGLPPPPGPDTQPYAGGAPPGSITATPSQGTAEFLNTFAAQKGIAGAQGEVAANAADKLAGVESEAAQEKRAHDADYQAALVEAASRHDKNHAQLEDAYQDYRKAAGSLKDPSSQFWADKGQGARVLSGLAAFASGMGSGLLGQAGNPYLDYLNKQTDKNFDAHRQNIKDLYEKQVAAGKIEDSDDSWQRFGQEAKLHGYDLASEHIKHDLVTVKNTALGQNQRLLAKNTIEGLDQQGIDRRMALSALQAKAKANAGSALRAAQAAEDKKAFEVHEKASAEFAKLPQADRNAAVANAMQGAGLSTRALGPYMEGLGVKGDPTTGAYERPSYATPETPESAKERDKKIEVDSKHKGLTDYVASLKEAQELDQDRGPGTDATANTKGEDLIERIAEASARSVNPDAKTGVKPAMIKEQKESLGLSNPAIFHYWGKGDNTERLAHLLKEAKANLAAFEAEHEIKSPTSGAPKKVSVADLPPAR
jgi:hypothetical protein